jgi:hypothetical protein
MTIPHIFQRVAAVLLLAVVVAAIIPNVRTTVINALYAWTAQYAEFKGDVHTELTYWEPMYIPPGYVETERFDSPGFVKIYYQDKNGSLLSFEATPKDASVAINNEAVSYRTETIGDIVYHVFEIYDDSDYNQIVWENAEALFNVSAQLPIGELLTVAQSVSPA